MLSFKDYYLIKEDPDTVMFGDDYLDYEQPNARPIILIKEFPNHLIYSKEKNSGETHMGLLKTLRLGYLNLADTFPSKMDKNTLEELNDYLFKNKLFTEEDNKVILGRYWRGDNIISFWSRKKQVVKYLPLIMDFLRFDNQQPEKFLYQFAESEKLIPYDQLSGNLKQTISKAEIDARRAEHMKSPMDKKKGPPKYQMPLSTPGQPGKKWWAMNSESAMR